MERLSLNWCIRKFLHMISVTYVSSIHHCRTWLAHQRRIHLLTHSKSDLSPSTFLSELIFLDLFAPSCTSTPRRIFLQSPIRHTFCQKWKLTPRIWVIHIARLHALNCPSWWRVFSDTYLITALASKQALASKGNLRTETEAFRNTFLSKFGLRNTSFSIGWKIY